MITLIKKVGINFDLTEDKMNSCLKNVITQDEILMKELKLKKNIKSTQHQL